MLAETCVPRRHQRHPAPGPARAAVTPTRRASTWLRPNHIAEGLPPPALPSQAAAHTVSLKAQLDEAVARADFASATELLRHMELQQK